MKKISQVLGQKIDPGEIAVRWLGQAGYLVKSRDKIICIDPYLSDSARKLSKDLTRMTPPPILSEELKCDLFLTTHNHLDHLDPDTIQRLKDKDKIIFIGPRTCRKTFLELKIKEENIIQIDIGEEKEICGIKIKGTFCIPNEESVLDSEGFIINLEDDIRLYFTGDTAYTDFLQYIAPYRIDIMFVCINGKYGNMNIVQAIKLANFIKPNVVIPSHYGMFAINDADPCEFKRKAEGLNCQILNLGEMYKYRKGD